MNTVHGRIVFMLPQSTQRPQRIRGKGSHTNAIPQSPLRSSRPPRFYFINRRDRKGFIAGAYSNFPGVVPVIFLNVLIK